jgi:hypothetical protein
LTAKSGGKVLISEIALYGLKGFAFFGIPYGAARLQPDHSEL